MPNVRFPVRAAAAAGLLFLVLQTCFPGSVIARRFPPVERARRTIADLAAGVDAFKKDMGSFPKTLVELITPAKGTRGWHGPYYFGDHVPLDPWDHPYIYTVPGKVSGKPYDLLSYGPDGEPGGGDDIINGADPQQ